MSNKKVLITGSAGFIGSHLTEVCVDRGDEVKAFIHYNSINSWGWLEKSKYKGEFEIIAGDIRDYDSVFHALKGCDTVFHLAALIGIPYSYASPLAYIRTNIEGTYNVLQASKELGTKNILITSTSETYGTGQYVPIDEKHPVIGQSPYSATKIAADHLALSYYRSFGLPIKVVRPFNTYGPRQSARAIIPTIITQILDGQNVIKVGNINPIRDFTFVKDTVNGFVEIAKTERFVGEIVNIGMSMEISIENLIKLISDLMQADITIQEEDQRIRLPGSEVERLCCDNTKILRLSNWKPKYNLKQGLLETIEWIRSNIAFYKPEIYNI